MNLTIKATHQKYAAHSLEKSFSTFPLIIGRSGSCDMVLQDTEQFVSSRHLQISYSAGQLSITDTSSNGTFINNSDVPVGRGNMVLLANGDRLGVGEYQLQVTFEQSQSASSSDDPFYERASTPAYPENDNSDPFAALGTVKPTEVVGIPNRHVDKLEDIGIGPSAWETNDNPFESKITNSNPSPVATPSGGNKPLDATDQWAGWLEDIPDPMAANRQATPKDQHRKPPDRAQPPRAPSINAADSPGDSINLLLAAAGLNPADYANADQRLLAQHIGKILNRSTHSMMLLLRSRDEIKNALRAEVTLLAATDNNPLKFSMSVEEALNRLLKPSQNDGFSTSEKAIDKALDDIKIHQIAMLEAMRASLQIALSHFEPEILEQRMSELNPLSATLPLARKAKLWDHFKTRYAEIKKEALDDFGNRFGEELRAAYEQSVKDMKR